MNHAQELNKLINFSANRTDFVKGGYRSFEAENGGELKQGLQRSNLFFTCSVLGMEAVSHVIEDQAVNLGGKFRFYSAFQKFSRFRPQEARYQKLLALNNPIYIFGYPDVQPYNAPNLNVVALEKSDDLAEDSLAHNWFVVLDNPQFVSMALLARELPPNNRPVGAPDKLVYRNFEGFWTYDREVINQVVNVLDDYINQQSAAVN